MAGEHFKSSSWMQPHTLQYDNDSIHEGDSESSNDSTDEIDEFVDSFYLDEVNVPTDDNQTNTPRGPNSDEDVYDLYAYTVASTPASESYQSMYFSRSNSFNEEDFEYKLGLAIARYDAKPRRWANCELDDGPNLNDSPVRGPEVNQDVTTESLSPSPWLEQCTAQDGG